MELSACKRVCCRVRSCGLLLACSCHIDGNFAIKFVKSQCPCFFFHRYYTHHQDADVLTFGKTTQSSNLPVLLRAFLFLPSISRPQSFVRCHKVKSSPPPFPDSWICLHRTTLQLSLLNRLLCCVLSSFESHDNLHVLQV